MSSRRAFEVAAKRAAWVAALFYGLLSSPMVAWARPPIRHVRQAVADVSPTPISASNPEEASTAKPAVSPEATNTPSAVEETNAFATFGKEVQTIFAKRKGAVVRIEAVDSYGPTAGTGFFVDPVGTIYTNYSVAGRAWNLTVEFAGKKYPATCLLADARSGVALLRIQAGQTPFLPIGDSADLKVASPVIAIGYPMDLPATPTFGLVAGFDQKFLDHFLPTTHIRANVPVQAGEAGAPLLNAKGEVVGMLICQFDFGAVCLSLPIQAAEKVRMDYMRFGRLHPGWIGVTAKSVDEDDENASVRVDQLTEESPAAQSGLKDGDILRRVGHTAIHHLADLRDASFFLTADEKVPIEVTRDGADLTVTVQAASPPGVSVSLPPALISNSGSGHLTLPAFPDPR